MLLHAAPMFHLADLAAWNFGMLTGSTHVIVPSFTPAAVAEVIARYGITDVLLVPTMIQLLVDSPEAADADLSSVRRIMYGASPISAAVLKRARARLTNAAFSQGYGMSELAGLATILTDDDHRDPSLAGSCGRAAAHCEVRIVDPSGNELPRGEVGEIVAWGDHVMDGYWGEPDETAAALRGGWMHTGDGGYMDSRGYVFIVDRLKDMIITGGENVFSIEVENALASHPAVAQAAVVGVPDEQWGERVHAVIVTRPGSTVTLEALQDHCRQHIAGYKVPRSGTFADALPVSGAGKILKSQLRAQFQGGSGGR
jgi:acyl-CoA synthetase (AMP-forming)/AMP-acid ligase II